MKNVILLRRQESPNSTQGILITPTDKSYQTLEQPWRDNKFRESCIPEGDYPCVWHNSPKFGWTYLLQNTEPRTQILIHIGNYPKDTVGCILLGTSSGQDVVWNSRLALDAFFYEMNTAPFLLRIVRFLK